ncbi:MAG TPA: histidine kinase N-terminal 7TM domain-containing protein [Longilinea sp.]|nr:histidine kinase N-terminal 7TM domain-containing protein [Longilinea sp.]
MAAAVICALIVVYVWPHRENNAETIPLVWLLLGIIEWIIAALAGLLDQNFSHKILWAKFEYIGVVSVPLTLLSYVFYHGGSDRHLTVRRLLWLAVIPVMTLVLAWTNEAHGLIWASYTPYLESGLVLSNKTYGIGFWIYWVYSYLLLLAATILVIRVALRSARLFRWQNILVVTGILMPWVGNFIYVLHISPFKDLDLTPLAFSITAIMLALGMFRWQLFDLRPIAQAAVVAGMTDGLMILDKQNRIVEVNPAAQAILGLSDREMVGRQMEQIIAAWVPPDERSDQTKGRTIELKLPKGKRNRDFELNDAPFYERYGLLGGRIVFLHDVTERNRLEEGLREAERKHAELLLKQAENKYEVLYQNMSVGVVYQSRDGSVVEMNPAAERILGAGQVQISDLPSIAANLITIHEDGSAFPAEEHPSMISLKTGKSLRNQLMGVYFPDEKDYHWININTVPQFKPGEDEPYQVFVTFDDITERKRAEAALTRQTEELRQRNNELNRLYRATQSLLSPTTSEVQDIANTIADMVLKEFGQNNCSVFLVDPNSNVLDRVAVVGPYADQVKKTVLTIDGAGQVPQAIRSGQVINTPDVGSNPTYIAGWEMARSELTIPLKADDRVIGVIDIQSAEAGAFSPDDERLIDIFAGRAVSVLKYSRLNEELERRIHQLTALHTIDTAISSSIDLGLTMGVLLDQVTDQLGVDAADVLIFDPPTQSFTYANGRGFRTQALQLTTLHLGDGYAGQAARDRVIVTIQDLLQNVGGLGRSHEFSLEGFITYMGVPLIAKGQLKGVLEIFQRSSLELGLVQRDFLEVLAGVTAIAIDSTQLFENLRSSNAELRLAYDKTIEGWSRAMDLRDKDTEGHTQRVTEVTLMLAEEMGLSSDELAHIRWGALLHDIGKIGIPDEILRKPGPLSEEEWVIMRKHPQLAYDMLSPITYLRFSLDIPYCHHEKWNGTGYPRGLRGEQIPLAARIFAVVDVWDALGSDRPYRKAWSRTRILQYIAKQAGKHFDPDVVANFLRAEFQDQLMTIVSQNMS